MCPQCALKVSDSEAKRQQAKRKARSDAGLCRQCGKAKADKGYASCKACRDKMNAWHREHYRIMKGVTV